jgi:penicillin-binding protein 2
MKEIRDPITGAIEQTNRPQVIHQSDLDPQVWEQVRRDMRGVVTNGTVQFPMNIRSVQIAGKTGTAEIGRDDRWHSWFAAYAPFNSNNPEEQVIVSIIVEGSNQWEWWAPYASVVIFQGIFADQTYSEAVRALGLSWRMPEGRIE